MWEQVVEWCKHVSLEAENALIVIVVTAIVGVLVAKIKNYSISVETICKTDRKKIRYFIPTTVTERDPCEYDEIKEADIKDRKKLIPYMLKELKTDKHQYYVILGDSGMGKTTFLHRFYIKYKRKIFKKRAIEFFSLTDGFDLSRLNSIKRKKNTILLLDALDEDIYAIENYEKRIDEIIHDTLEFYKIIITCRTQFFPDEESELSDTRYTATVSSHKEVKFKKLYICPLSDLDIKLYLKRIYRYNKEKQKKAFAIVKKVPYLMARPMLLNFIDFLITSNYTRKLETLCDIYEGLVEQWILRERRNRTGEELLRTFIHNAVLYLFEKGELMLSSNDIANICSKEELKLLTPIFAKSRSLLNRNGKGDYKFSHRSIYEYLISKEAINNVAMRRELLRRIKRKEISPIFYRELCIHHVKQNRDLSEMILDGCDFNNILGVYANQIDMKNTNFSNSNLTNTYFIKIDLTNSNFKGANLAGSCFRKANLTGADLTGADLTGANLTEADLTGADLTETDLTSVNLTKADLTETELRETKLEGANFKDTKLNDFFLTGTDYTGVNISDSEHISINFDGEKYNEIKISKALIGYIEISEELSKNIIWID